MMKKLSLLVATFTLLALPLQVGMAQDNVDLPPEIANMESEGFTIVPANPNPPESSNFTFKLGPGSEVRDSVIIKNLSSEPATFYLYGADPTFSQQGTKAYKTRADSGEGEGQWITFDEPEVMLQGGEQKQAFFTLKIPQSTSFGEYRAGIAMEKTKKDINNPNITIATRLVLHTDMSITNIPPTKDGQINGVWQAYYFWISLTLFLVSLTALIWITFEENKEKAATKKKKSSARKSKASSAKTTRKTTTKKKK
ncbi:DUF916 domain-containing protein [Candidatus Peregrinibacteria bacterium]|nr:DUF916 domain-containing protein [Candidatus Peregrinibacteria bacterium]